MNTIKNIHNNIYNNCILVMIAHSIMARKYPEINYEFSYNDVTFNINNGEGCRASISFCKNAVVGFFQDISLIDIKDASLILEKVTNGFPDEIINIANSEALQYLLDYDNRLKIEKPLVTTAFYLKNEENIIYTNHSYEDFIKNGAHLIENQLKSFESTYEYLVNYFEMEEFESKLLLQIYKLKMESEEKRYSKEKTYLSEKIRSIIEKDFEESFQFSIDSFNEINIVF